VIGATAPSAGERSAAAGPAPTLTLADLYARQGLVGKARDIYLRLARDGSPGEREEAARRLEALGPPARTGIELLEVLLSRVAQRRRESGLP
jgi:hypothetical protein